MRVVVEVRRGAFARLPILIPPKAPGLDVPSPPSFRTERIGPEGRVGDFVVEILAVCEAGCHALVAPADTDYDPEVVEAAELRPLRDCDLKKYGNREQQAG